MLDKALKQNRDEDKDPFFSACAYGDLKGAQDCVDIGGSEPHKARNRYGQHAMGVAYWFVNICVNNSK